MPKTGSYAARKSLGWKKRILRGVFVNFFQHETQHLFVMTLI